MKKTTFPLPLTTLTCDPNVTRRACLWTALGLLAALAFGPPPAQAAVTEAWVHRYNNVVSNANDQASKVVRDAAGDIIVTGTTDDRIHGSDMLTIKYAGATGSVLWQQRYNGPANGEDQPTALAVDGSGNVVVTGVVVNTNGNRDYYTVKYAAADGALLWEKRYNGPANSYDYASAAAVDGSGNVVVTGSSSGTNGYSDYYTAKYAAADGALLWEKRYDGPANSDDQAQALAVDGSGNVVVTGTSWNDYYTAKYAGANGALLWEKRYNGPNTYYGYNEVRAVAVDGSGNVIVTGRVIPSGGYYIYDYYTAKYAAADGALLWEKRYHGPANSSDGARAVAVDSSGNVVVTGYSYNTNGNTDYYTAKYAAANGTLLWEKRYNGPGNGYDEAQAVTVDASGNVVVTGYSVGAYTAKYAAADGALLWEKHYNGGEARAVALDGSGNVVVTGSSYGTNSSAGYYTAKYAAGDGALLWEKGYAGLSKGYNEARAVVVDGSGNLVVSGFSEGNWGSGDYYTAKYAAADGALLWEKRYDGPANSDDQAQALAVDGSGNVVVTGSSSGTYGYTEYYTAKYAAADGALLWEQRSNGSGNGDDKAKAVAVDGRGNVVVTGYSYNTNGNTDYYTAKYAVANGAPLWERRYNGPANSDDRANAVAVDGSGNVLVTGSTDGNGSSYRNYSDYYTAKYAAADGALLWEKRYNGPANKRDQAQAVAVDASGNVVVTGISDAIFGCYDCDWQGDYYTAKYAAADGALLWEQRYNGSTNGFDYAKAVAVDGSGNVVVTGYSNWTNNDYFYTAKYASADGALLWEKRSNDGGQALVVDGSGNVVVTGGTGSYLNADYYTAKYAAADGALLWEKRYNGPANGDDRVAGLALGPNGMVAVTGTSSGDYATVVYRDDVYPISIALVPTGIQLRFPGVPGRSYTIERAPALTGPWSTLATPTAPIGGLIEYTDTNPSVGTAFYRTVQP